jgi:hypothetical protein
MPALAALAVAYALGEGIGRLACISFGCCYGKPVSECGPFLRRLFAKRSFVFQGGAKKVAYDGGLEGVAVVPVQAITSTVLVSVALAGAALFLSGRFAAAFLLSSAATHGWRVISEFLRADYRGNGKLSAYQIMALLTIAYSVALCLMSMEQTEVNPSILDGARALWEPLVIIGVQFIGIAVFVHSGRSKVTAATISVYIRR